MSELELLEPGRFLYHYTAWETASQHIIPTRKMRLSPYSRMNDPMEALSPSIGAAVGYAPGHTDAEGRIAATHGETQDAMGRMRAISKLLCLTTDAEWATQANDIERRFAMGWARPRMWHQYAQNHTGACLIFEREAFEPLVVEQLRRRSPNSTAGAVTYTRTGIAGTAAPIIVLNRDSESADVARQQLERFATELFFTKLVDWEAECEYRFVEPSEDDAHSYVDVGDSLVGFMLGHKASPEVQIDAVKLGREHGLNSRQIKWNFANGPWPGSPNVAVTFG
jgi:hypothetical protein